MIRHGDQLEKYLANYFDGETTCRQIQHYSYYMQAVSCVNKNNILILIIQSICFDENTFNKTHVRERDLRYLEKSCHISE